jgi:hypothetical protein
LSRVLWLDEAIFTASGTTDLYSWHDWALENPHATRQPTFQHSFNVNVGAGVINKYLIKPYFIEEHIGWDQYIYFLEATRSRFLEDVPLDICARMWFHHDGAPPHFTRQLCHLLDTNYSERWIGRGGPVSWLQRSPDLTFLDYFSCECLKKKAYATEAHNRDQV